MSLADRIIVDDAASAARAEACEQILTAAPSRFEAEQEIARGLGGQVDADGLASFGFWVPELQDLRVPSGDVFLEILSPTEPLDLTRAHQDVRFERIYVPAIRARGTCLCLRSRHEGRQPRADRRFLRPGLARCRGSVAPRSSTRWRCPCPSARWPRPSSTTWTPCRPRAATPPISQGFAGDGPHKFGPPLEHPADPRPDRDGGRHHRRAHPAIRAPRRARRARPAAGTRRSALLGYDAVQLLPVEPTTVYETGPDFWQETEGTDDGGHRLSHRAPIRRTGAMTSSSPAWPTVNPVLLETGRPDELVDLASVLHNFPRQAQEAGLRRGLRPFRQSGPARSQQPLLRRAEHVRPEPRLPESGRAGDPAGDAAPQGEFRRRRRARRRRAGLQVVGQRTRR